MSRVTFTTAARPRPILRSTFPGRRPSTLQAIQNRYTSSTSSQDSNAIGQYDDTNPNHNYWWTACAPSLTSLLRHSNSYTPTQQSLHLTWFRNNVIPNLGPRPSSSYRLRSPLNYEGSPYRPTWNFCSAPPGSSSSSPKVKGTLRFSFEPIPATGTSEEDPTNQEGYRRLFPLLAGECHGVGGVETKADLTWYNEVKEHMYLLNQERAVLKERLVPGQLPPEHAAIAIACSREKRVLKPYFFAGPTSLVTGFSPHQVLFSALRAIRTRREELKPAIKLVESYVSSRASTMTPSCFGIDAVSPFPSSDQQGGAAAAARVKLYTLVPSNAFSVMRDAMTMGGRLASPESLRGVALLKWIYHLLRGDRSRVSEATYHVSKPCRYETRKNSYWMGFTSYEMQPGREDPDVKVYLPLMQFFETEEAVVAALETVWRVLGWGEELGKGGYREAVREAFPHVDFKKAPGTHTWVSFSYSDRSGPYMTVYLAPRFQEAYDLGVRGGR
ncbi:tryptophan dimethylallyltransferase-domain-containing protein [Sordaria sp. MPI-SDFR-AT-0083]|nr:tryptophan dimethylallyltransferase-domain-containing protein [Sordaria sp. MPI-SDFR-AT-0083]